MNLTERFDVSPGKVSALLEKIKRLNIDASKIGESFVRGSGKGGQKINKTSNAVVLTYPPFNLRVRVQKERRRTINRFLALRELTDRVESIVSPGNSVKDRAIAKLRRRKSRSKRKSRLKYGGSPA